MNQCILDLDKASFGGISRQNSANSQQKSNQSKHSTSSTQILKDSEEKVSKKSPQKLRSNSKKVSKAQNFALYQDQRILKLILKYGPKFKKISRLLNGKPENIIKNRYYRHLRYKWDEILGEEYAHLNENKEKNNFQQILKDSPLVPEYSKIITNLFLEMQAVLSNCLASTNSKN